MGVRHVVGGLLALLLAPWPGSVGAQLPPVPHDAAPAAAAPAENAPAPLRLRVIGGLAGIAQYVDHEEPFWSRDLARLSSGRYQADITPFDRAGLQNNEMLRLAELGVVPFGTLLLSGIAAQYPQFSGLDLAGLNPDVATLRTHLKAFRPYLEMALRTQHNLQVLAVYAYPAQVLFCQRPLTGLASLAGRRVRVATAAQADFLEGLGAQPVLLPFGALQRSLQEGGTECAVTGTLSGYTLGLYRQTRYLYPLPLTWGIALFVAHRGTWLALPEELRALLGQELPRLEERIWSAAERDTAEGVACNSGAASCTRQPRGAMELVPISPEDSQRSRQIFTSIVLPRWLRRCAVDCTGVWNHTLGLVTGIAAPELP